MLGVFVMDEYVDMGWGSACDDMEGVYCGTDSSGDFVGAYVESTLDCKAVLEYYEGRCLVSGMGDWVDHDVSNP